MVAAASHKPRRPVRLPLSRRGFVVAGALCLLSCKQDDPDFVVFAAASLGPFLEQMAASFEGARPTTHLRFNLGGSARLARQLLAAPKGDLFISASHYDLEGLVRAKLVDTDGIVTLFENRLALVAHKDSKLQPADPATLLLSTKSVISVADPEAAPLGRYSKAWLEGLRPELWQQISSRLSPMPDARAAVTQVERRPDALGVVYRSDARTSSRLKVLYETSASEGPLVEYVAGIVNGRPHTLLARAFLKHMATPTARRLYQDLGFVAPRTK